MKMGNNLNGVIVKFNPGTDAEIKANLFDFMRELVTTDIQDFMDAGTTYKIISLQISSTSEPCPSHKPGAPHRDGLAIDIAAINGKSIKHLYSYDQELTGICDALQVKATDLKNVFESFGPLICFKIDKAGNSRHLTKDMATINSHKDHLHFSVR